MLILFKHQALKNNTSYRIGQKWPENIKASKSVIHLLFFYGLVTIV